MLLLIFAGASSGLVIPVVHLTGGRGYFIAPPHPFVFIVPGK